MCLQCCGVAGHKGSGHGGLAPSGGPQVDPNGKAGVSAPPKWDLRYCACLQGWIEGCEIPSGWCEMSDVTKQAVMLAYSPATSDVQLMPSE